MATKVYDSDIIFLIDGTEIEIIPLKIKYLREFMKEFEPIYRASDDYEAIDILTKCTRICMKQYYPKISKSIKQVEENIDLPTIYKIVDIAAGIKIKGNSEKPVKKQATDSGVTWNELDLAKLEAEAFMLGIWKDYNELETSLSMPELMLTLKVRKETDYDDKKFFAAIQGVDLDSATNSERGQKEWEDMKARVFSKGATNDSNDILALQGINAQKAGFGIGLGLDYSDERDPNVMKK